MNFPILSKPYLIIDTCIIQAASSKKKPKSEKFIQCLEDLAHIYRLTISEYSVYENLQGLWGKQAEKAVELLKKYEWKVVSHIVLTLSAVLGGLYHDENRLDINDGDKMIGATAILEEGFILTENHSDFPPPFFFM